MKQFYIFCMIIAVEFPLFGDDPFFKIDKNMISPPITIYDINEVRLKWNTFDALVYKNKLFIFIYNNKGIKESVELTKENVRLNRDGYYTFNYNNNSYVLLGGGDLILPVLLPYYDNLENVPYPPPQNTSEIPLMNVFWFWDDGIEKIETSSYLIEKSSKGQIVQYDATNLRNNFYGIYDAPVYFNSRKLIWAEGKNGPGIGEWIDISFREATDHIMIINGYVNLFRMDLYKANNRIKSARVISEAPDFQITYEFEDIAKFHEIILPQNTKRIRIIIETVYKGTRFDDTCVTGVYLKQKTGFKTHPYYTILVRNTQKYDEIIRLSEEDLKLRKLLK